MSEKSICIVITASMNLHSLYRDQFKFLMTNGYKVTAVASPGIEHEWIRAMGVDSIEVEISRRPDLFKDLITLKRLYNFFRENKFDVIVVSTPKASLLGALSARLSRQKNVVYMIRGRAYENFTGLKRTVYSFLDQMTCMLSHKVLSISLELKNKYILEGICLASKITVLGKGSSNGVDTNRFNKENVSYEDRNSIRKKLSIEDNATVFIYCGRLRKDKGTHELVSAFNNLDHQINGRLILLGSFEKFDELDSETLKEIESNEKIDVINWAKNVEAYFAISDVFVFPSHREGFGNVAIEASSMSLPIIGYDVVGLRESIDNNVSGVLVEKSNVEELTYQMNLLAQNELERQKLGNAGRVRVEDYFDSKIVWNNLLNYYDKSIIK